MREEAAVQVAIVGAGGLARQILDAIDACQDAGQDLAAAGFIDENAALWGTTINERPVLGGFDWFDAGAGQGPVRVIVGIGSPDVRKRVVAQATRLGLAFHTVVHPTAVISRYAALGSGVAVLAGAVVESQARLGDHVVVNKLCSIGHDTTIGEFCTLAPGALIAGNVDMGPGVDVGIGAATIQGIRIAEGAVVGGQAMVVKDVPADATVVGVPAKVIKVREPGWSSR